MDAERPRGVPFPAGAENPIFGKVCTLFLPWKCISRADAVDMILVLTIHVFVACVAWLFEKNAHMDVCMFVLILKISLTGT